MKHFLLLIVSLILISIRLNAFEPIRISVTSTPSISNNLKVDVLNSSGTLIIAILDSNSVQTEASGVLSIILKNDAWVNHYSYSPSDLLRITYNSVVLSIERMEVVIAKQSLFGATISPNELDQTGNYTFNTITVKSGDVELKELATNGDYKITLKAPETLSSDLNLIFPSNSGTSGNVLSTNGAGTLSWVVAGSGWNLTGNAGTTPGTDFIGTTDNNDVVIKRNNIQSGLLNTALDNTSWGVNALKPTTTGSGNTANGYYALNANTTGGSNTANGIYSLLSNTIGSMNTAIGQSALQNNTTAGDNVAIGNYALTAQSFSNGGVGYPTFNIAIGEYALGSNQPTTTSNGDKNTAVGINALNGNTIGYNNVANGYRALQTNTTGYNNTAIGYNADVSGSGLTNATAIGANAYVGASNSLVLGSINGVNSATASTIVGIGTTTPVATLDIHGVSGTTLKVVDGNQAAGKVLTSDASGNASWQATSAWSLTGNSGTTAETNFIGTTDNNDVVIKRNNVQAGLLNNALYNTSWGVSALSPTTTGIYNNANGYKALRDNTTGEQNTANGGEALEHNTTGNLNTATGMMALYNNTIGTSNTANGAHALAGNTTAGQNTAIGHQALVSQSFSNSSNAWNSDNVAIGYNVLQLNQPTSTSNGIQNTAIGNWALYRNTTGYQNTANGYQAGSFIADGSTANQTSSTSVYLGANTKASADGRTNEIVIGYSATGSGDNTATLGNTTILTTVLRGNVTIGTCLTLTPSAAPSSPSEGTIYYNSTDHKAYCWNGTSWNALW